MLDSVYEQGLSESCFEVVVINDGTPDGSMQIVEEYVKKHGNLNVLNKENGGVSSARNMGLDAAKGKYALFLDADDELIEGSLPFVIDYLGSHEKIDMMVTRQIRKCNNHEWEVKAPALLDDCLYDGLETYKRQYVKINAGGGICRVEFLKKNSLRFPEGVKNGEDTIFFGLVQIYAQSIVFKNHFLYRINEVQSSASRNNYSIIGRRFACTMNEVAIIRKSIVTIDRARRGIFEYVVYQLLSNTTNYYTLSSDLTYIELKKNIKLKELLPLDTRNMFCMKRQARIMNFSFTLYYFLYWIKNKTKIRKNSN